MTIPRHVRTTIHSSTAANDNKVRGTITKGDRK